MTALTAVAGTIIVFILSTAITPIAHYMIPFAAGNFIYIAASDLIPELHQKRHVGTSILQIVLLIVGVVVIGLFKE